MTDKSKEPVGLLARGTTALLAGSVLLAGAAINKLPDITCAVMAQTYAGAVANFGIAALCGGLCFVGMKKYPLAAWVVFGIGAVMFYFSVLTAAVNVQRSATWCTAEQPHKDAPPHLLGLLTF